MIKNRRRNTFLALFVLGAIAFGSIQDGGAIASEMEIAQNIGNLCQQVAAPQGLTVHQRPSPNSPIVGNLTFNQQVTLADAFRNIRGPAGRTWTEITFPIRGYVARGFPGSETGLINCNGVVTNPVPNPSVSPLCRQVDRQAAPRGAVVRASASTTSARVGGVPAGDLVLLVPNFQRIPDLNGEGRNWVEITFPARGFISANTLVFCR